MDSPTLFYPPISPTPTPPVHPSPPRAARRLPYFAMVAVTAVLSASVASATTFGLLSSNVAPTSTATPAPVVQTVSTVTNEDADISAVVAQAAKSVVTITSQTTVRRPFGQLGRATGVGSGVIVSADGYILTNNHVIENSTGLSVELADGTTYSASVVKQSAEHDLALIKVEANGLPAAALGDSSSVKVGQMAIAIGSPLGEYTGSVTRGIISALGRDITVGDDLTGRTVDLKDLIQTDAAINHGNSGGPLLNSSGQVIGINTAMAQSAENLGFATPINAAADLLAAAGAEQAQNL
jgi:S1-C subfamily serine protease